jgi:glycosyltransferase involved in cell wall biosynthesis
VTPAKQTAPASTPKLTALMPVKGHHEPYLHEAVLSMLAQACPDWRLLVITGRAQRSELEGVLAGYLDDPRIELIVSDTGQIAANLNAGMRGAKTDFVASLLGDDLWAPDTVEVLTNNIVASPEIDFFHSSRRYIDDRGSPISSVYRSRPTVSADDFLRSSPVKHLLCWRRETGLAIGGMDESLKSVGVDDFDFPWSMAEQGATFKAVPECLYVFRDHRESFRLTTHLTLRHHKHELARIMRKHGADDSTIAARLAIAERSYLRQCLYRSRIDRWIKTLRGHDPRRGWREPYQ